MSRTTGQQLAMIDKPLVLSAGDFLFASHDTCSDAEQSEQATPQVRSKIFFLNLK